jgi:hypothetical protein
MSFWALNCSTESISAYQRTRGSQCSLRDSSPAKEFRVIRVSIGSAHDQRDVALSTLDLASEEAGLQPKSDWLIALGKWDEALLATKRELVNGERDLFSVIKNQVS